MCFGTVHKVLSLGISGVRGGGRRKFSPCMINLINYPTAVISPKHMDI